MKKLGLMMALFMCAQAHATESGRQELMIWLRASGRAHYNLVYGQNFEVSVELPSHYFYPRLEFGTNRAETIPYLTYDKQRGYRGGKKAQTFESKYIGQPISALLIYLLGSDLPFYIDLRGIDIEILKHAILYIDLRSDIPEAKLVTDHIKEEDRKSIREFTFKNHGLLTPEEFDAIKKGQSQQGAGSAGSAGAGAGQQRGDFKSNVGAGAAGAGSAAQQQVETKACKAEDLPAAPGGPGYVAPKEKTKEELQEELAAMQRKIQELEREAKRKQEEGDAALAHALAGKQ